MLRHSLMLGFEFGCVHDMPCIWPLEAFKASFTHLLLSHQAKWDRKSGSHTLGDSQFSA